MSRIYVISLESLLFLLVVCAGHAAAGDAGVRNLGAEGSAPAEDIAALVQAEWIADDRRFNATGPTREPTGPVTTAQDAAGAVDGITDSQLGFHVQSGETDPWWQVDLTRVVPIERVVVYNRTDGNTAPRTRHIQILVAQQGAEDCMPRDFRRVHQHDGSVFHGAAENAPLVVTFDEPIDARVVRLRVPGKCSFALVEVEVYAAGAPDTNIALGRPANQKSVHSTASSRGTKGHPLPGQQAGTTFSIDHTREVLDRAAQLAARLHGQADPERLAPLVEWLEALTHRAKKAATANERPEPLRRELYIDARRLLRRIAWTNPVLLEIDKLLFVKRHDPGGLFHMVHQYYGFGAKPGGGLYVLSEPFSDEPELIDLLADSPVENGRLAGRRLVPGAFLAPEVSYDGQTILFPYTEGLDSMPDRGVWSPEACYHIFRVNADGSGLVQLTDGSYNDFDPCLLPDGRIVFISERRGGFLRCGGSAPRWPSPTYTLHSMEPDGSDIITLSYHETQEWNPSVNNEGMLVYTRWDYVDRDTNVAHHKWICYPDGRDPRAFHGNYPTGRRSDRPWMEMQIRAIPDSHRYVAVAAAHHGHEFGSLVLIDLRAEDDGAMSQLTRLTPEVPFPESEGHPTRNYMVYGTPWPLSEEDYLVVYDAEGAESGRYNRGIYWMDRFGNRELIYRDPEISCYAPMPLRPRRRPPVIPRQTLQAKRDVVSAADESPQSTVAVMNVYDSQFDWPEETEIESLRIIHVLPKTTSPANQPRIGVANAANARAVLGTVPVESDGSAFFEAPVGKLIYFQALDREGMAVQSMRSGTYVHPGEQLTCQGCHEDKHTPPDVTRGTPLALRRGPSPIEPEPEGSNPFSYVRLVQPVLDGHCVECHRQQDAVDLGGAIEAPHGFSRSYNNLAGQHGFYFHSTNGSFRHPVHGRARTEAGRFGARAATLTPYLDESHHGVKLTDQERRRVILWLDANSDFFGAYEDTAAQSRGEIVYPSLK